jgi:TolB protein
LPGELDLILNKALEKDRDLRYQTASDFRADIKRLLRIIDSSPTSSRTRSTAFRLGKSSSRRRWLWQAIGVLGVLVAAVLAGWSFIKSKAATPDWSRAANLQLTNQAGTEFFPSLSPDGKSFVFAAMTNGNFDLFVQRVGGKVATLLTPNSPANDTEPTFSPDGERIAFHSERQPRGIYVMGATGENVRRVVEGGYHPTWSPDGKEIAYSSEGYDLPATRNTNPSKITIVNVETGAKRLLTEADAMQPSWSPGGHRIAFWFMPPALGRSDVATISIDGGEPVVVTTDASTNWNPVWSPDGKFLYFASDRGGNMNFWRVEIDEKTGKVLSEPEAVITPSRYSRHLNFSRDGKRMIYVQTDEQSNILGVHFDPKSERLVGDPFWITSGDRRVVLPDLSPDGKRFILRLPRRNQDDLAVYDLDSKTWQDLTNDKFFDRYPRWSPDGKKIVFNSDRGGNYELWMIDADGTNLQQISFNSTLAGFPLFSPDGNKLLFRLYPRTAIIDLSKRWRDQTPTLLPKVDEAGATFVPWDWSQDGKKVAGTISNPVSIGYYSFETNKYERVAEVNTIPRWLADGRRMIFVSEGKLFVIDTVTKNMRELYSRDREEIRSVGTSRDNTLLYFTARLAESDIWLLDLE